ncbi:MAG: hypothetical protein WA213_20875 [Terriglobales bacterium]
MPIHTDSEVYSMQQPAALSFKITSKEKITPVSDTVGTAGSPTSVTFTLSVPSAYPQQAPHLVPAQK